MIKHGTNPCLSIDANALVCSSKIRSQVQTEEELHLLQARDEKTLESNTKKNLNDFQEANEAQHHSFFEGKTASTGQLVENTVIIFMETLYVS